MLKTLLFKILRLQQKTGNQDENSVLSMILSRPTEKL